MTPPDMRAPILPQRCSPYGCTAARLGVTSGRLLRRSDAIFTGQHMKILIRNGRVIDPASGRDGIADLAIAAGRIVAIGSVSPISAPTRSSTPPAASSRPGLVDLAARLREPGHEHEGMLESELQAAAAGGVTSLVCPPDTDPVLDEPGLVEMLKFRARKLSRCRLFPLGALTRGLDGEVLTEMVELTEAGCVGFSQADVAAGRHPGAATRAAVRRHLRLRRLAAAAGRTAGQGRGRQRRGCHTPGAVGRAGGGRDDCAAHHLRADARHRCTRAPVPPEQCRRRGAGACRQGRRAADHGRREHQFPAPDRCRHRLLQRRHAADTAAAPAARPRRAARCAGRRHHRRAGVRPHPGRRRRQEPCRSPRPSPAPPAWNCC